MTRGLSIDDAVVALRSADRGFRLMLWTPVVMALMVTGTGCQLNVDMLTDELAHRPPVTTPSAEAARATVSDRAPVHRAFPTMQVQAKDGTVTHGVLYFEDPFERIGSDDGRFAWTEEELLYLLYGSARFVLNTAFMPISAMATPPWLVMSSDGRHVVSVPVGDTAQAAPVKDASQPVPASGVTPSLSPSDRPAQPTSRLPYDTVHERPASTGD